MVWCEALDALVANGLGAVMGSVIVSVRVDESLRDALAVAAMDRGVTMNRYLTQQLASIALAPAPEPPTPAVVDGPLVTAVRDQLANDDPIRLEALVLLARQAEAGQPLAAVRLLAVMREGYDAAEAELELMVREWADHLATPEHTYCQRCRAPMTPDDLRSTSPYPGAVA
jgi:hypothetical protein